MASTDDPDLIADWFSRHRVKLAVIVFVVLVLGRLPALVEGTTEGVVGFAYAVVFFGLLSWSWASRQDRSEAGYWFKFASLWTLLLAVQVGMVLVSVLRGNAFQGRWMIPIVVVALLALVNWWPYRRIRSGKPFPVQSA